MTVEDCEDKENEVRIKKLEEKELDQTMAPNTEHVPSLSTTLVETVDNKYIDKMVDDVLSDVFKNNYGQYLRYRNHLDSSASMSKPDMLKNLMEKAGNMEHAMINMFHNAWNVSHQRIQMYFNLI